MRRTADRVASAAAREKQAPAREPAPRLGDVALLVIDADARGDTVLQQAEGAVPFRIRASSHDMPSAMTLKSTSSSACMNARISGGWVDGSSARFSTPAAYTASFDIALDLHVYGVSKPQPASDHTLMNASKSALI